MCERLLKTCPTLQFGLFYLFVLDVRTNIQFNQIPNLSLDTKYHNALVDKAKSKKLLPFQDRIDAVAISNCGFHVHPDTQSWPEPQKFRPEPEPKPLYIPPPLAQPTEEQIGRVRIGFRVYFLVIQNWQDGDVPASDKMRECQHIWRDKKKRHCDKNNSIQMLGNLRQHFKNLPIF